MQSLPKNAIGCKNCCGGLLTLFFNSKFISSHVGLTMSRILIFTINDLHNKRTDYTELIIMRHPLSESRLINSHKTNFLHLLFSWSDLFKIKMYKFVKKHCSVLAFCSDIFRASDISVTIFLKIVSHMSTICSRII